MRRTFVAILLAISALADHANAQEPTTLETVTCQGGETFYFWMWSWMAGSANPANAMKTPRVAKIEHRTKDGRMLRGFRLTAGGTPKGAILVVQGNAWLADQLVPHLEPYRDEGYDVYVFDFRGYGLSVPALRRMRAMISDYAELAEAISKRGYKKRVVYAFSFGGILALNALRDGKHTDAIIVDSTFGRVPTEFQCPAAMDPAALLPTDCGRMLLLGGTFDGVVNAAQMQPLVDRGKACGAKSIVDDVLDHPFQGESVASTQKRTATILEFLNSAR